MEAAASDGPMEGLLEKCSGTFPQPSHRTLEIAPAASAIPTAAWKTRTIPNARGLVNDSAKAHNLALMSARVRVSHSSHRPYYYYLDRATEFRPEADPDEADDPMCPIVPPMVVAADRKTGCDNRQK